MKKLPTGWFQNRWNLNHPAEGRNRRRQRSHLMFYKLREFDGPTDFGLSLRLDRSLGTLIVSILLTAPSAAILDLSEKRRATCLFSVSKTRAFVAR